MMTEHSFNQPIEEVRILLERSHLNPRLCDQPVEYYDAGVHAGDPAMPGVSTRGEYLMLPRELVGWNPEFIIDVIGDSMKGAGILPGDRLRVQVGAAVRDGDMVVASIDGECTVKAYCEDEQGEKWLVPCNEAYDAIHLTDEMDVRLVGKVVGHMKETPRTPMAELIKSIRRTRGRMRMADRSVTPERMEAVIREMAEEVKHGRQWYAVYRSMVDLGALADGDYVPFCERVAALLPGHGHLPLAAELRRMAVQTFRKPAALWERGDAPVTGQRFDDYLRIARLTAEKLMR